MSKTEPAKIKVIELEGIELKPNCSYIFTSNLSADGRVTLKDDIAAFLGQQVMVLPDYAIGRVFQVAEKDYSCEICGADPMGVDCNNANCDR